MLEFDDIAEKRRGRPPKKRCPVCGGMDHPPDTPHVPPKKPHGRPPKDRSVVQQPSKELAEFVEMAVTLPESLPECLSDGTPNPFRSKQMQALTKKLAGSSASRSDVLASYLIFRGIGADTIFKIVDEAAKADIVTYGAGNKEYRYPDWSTRRWAAEFLAKTLGYLYVSKQEKSDAPPFVLQFWQEIKATSDQALALEAQRLNVKVDGIDLDAIIENGEGRIHGRPGITGP